MGRSDDGSQERGVPEEVLDMIYIGFTACFLIAISLGQRLLRRHLRVLLAPRTVCATGLYEETSLAVMPPALAFDTVDDDSEHYSTYMPVYSDYTYPGPFGNSFSSNLPAAFTSDTHFPSDTTPEVVASTAVAFADDVGRGGLRHRRVAGYDEVTKIRKMSACYRCRIRGLKCDTDTICHPSSMPGEKRPGAEFIRKTCIREIPSKLRGPGGESWNSEGSLLQSGIGASFNVDEGIKLRVRIPSNTHLGPYLEVVAYPLTSPNRTLTDKKMVIKIPQDEKPTLNQINDWFELTQRDLEADDNFQLCIEKLLLNHAASNTLDKIYRIEEEPDTRSRSHTRTWKVLRKQKALLDNIRSMSRMWKLSPCEIFDVRSIDDSPLSSDVDISAIECHLRLAGSHAMAEFEGRIFKDLDMYLSRRDAVELGMPLNIARWITLWQLILLYRDGQSMIPALGLQGTLSQEEDNALVRKRDVYLERNNTPEQVQRLYEAVVVIYSEMFRSPRMLEALIENPENVFDGDRSLHDDFRKAWRAHKQFYVKASELAADRLLESLVVTRERRSFRGGQGVKRLDVWPRPSHLHCFLFPSFSRFPKPESRTPSNRRIQNWLDSISQ